MEGDIVVASENEVRVDPIKRRWSRFRWGVACGQLWSLEP